MKPSRGTDMPEMPRKRHPLRIAAVLLGLMVGIVVVAAIVNRGGSSVPDMPASFGPGNTCYYVMDPAEAASLKQQGKCQRSDAPVQAPHSWLVTYYAFYDSAWYRSTIVAKSAQSSYDSYMTTFGNENATEIDEQAPKARYVDSDGAVVSGSDAGVSSDGKSITGGDDGSGGHGGGFGGDDGGFHGGDGE